MPTESGAQPSIPLASTAMVFNDMINANLRSGDAARDRTIEESGIIAASARLVAELREKGVPIVWIRVERRADRRDVVDTLTDQFLAASRVPKLPITASTSRAANVDELPVLEVDQVVLKPRFDPFIGTDLDLRLRGLGIDTILLGGYATNIGVESCARTAHDLGYNVVVLADCCFNVDRASHEWSLTTIMPNFARVMPSTTVLDFLT